MEITMLGTGHALTTKCYNTCFIIRHGARRLLVDGGGGNTLLRQMERAGIPWNEVREIFVTHRHIDHILGIVWMLRMICQHMSQGVYEGTAVVFAGADVIRLLHELAGSLLPARDAGQIGKRLRLVPVSDGETGTLLGQKAVFFDTGAEHETQYGFCLELEDGGQLTCCGDVPLQPRAFPYAKQSKWLLHEAFCLDSQADRFRPHEKGHCTVREACETAQLLGVQNLLLYHTEDHCLDQRKLRYIAEGSSYFSGGLFVPDDLETIVLS